MYLLNTDLFRLLAVIFLFPIAFLFGKWGWRGLTQQWMRKFKCASQLLLIRLKKVSLFWKSQPEWSNEKMFSEKIWSRVHPSSLSSSNRISFRRNTIVYDVTCWKIKKTYQPASEISGNFLLVMLKTKCIDCVFSPEEGRKINKQWIILISITVFLLYSL